MTDQQLYLTIGIPSILVLISWASSLLTNNSRFKALESQINDVKADIRILTAEIRDDVRRLNDLALEHAQRLTKLER